MTFASTVAAQVAALLGVSKQTASQLVNNAVDILGIASTDGRPPAETMSSSPLAAASRWSTEEDKINAVVEVAVSAHFENASASAATSSNSAVAVAAAASPSRKKRPRPSPSASPAANMQQKTMGAYFALPPGKSLKTQRTLTSMMNPKKDERELIKLETTTYSFHSDGDKDDEVEAVEILDDEASSGENKVGIKREEEEEAQVKPAPVKMGDQPNDEARSAGAAIKSDPTNARSNSVKSESDSANADAVQVEFSSTEFDANALAEIYIARKTSPPFLHLARALTLVSSNTKRLEKERVLTNLLLSLLYYDRMRGIEWDEEKLRSGELLFPDSGVLHAVLLSGNVASTGLVLNIGHTAISQAICNALSCSSAKLSEKARDAGEMGDAAADIFLGRDVGSGASGGVVRQTRLTWGPPPKPLLLSDITDAIASLHSLAKGGGGKGVEGKRKDSLYKIFSRCKEHEEVRFAVKIYCEHVRTGATLLTLLRCLSAAHVLQVNGYINANWQDGNQGKSSIGKADIEQAQEQFRINYSRHRHLKECILSLVKFGLDGMTARCGVQVFCPVQPMLAAPSKGVEEVLNHYAEYFESACDDVATREDIHLPQDLESAIFITAEYKYDGQRAQIHAAKQGGAMKVQIYSRHLDDMTAKFTNSLVPWIQTNWPENGLSALIIDAEICAVKRNGGKHGKDTVLLPFQVLSTMKRSEEESSSNVGVDVCVFAFDALLIDDADLLSRPLTERRGMLRERLGSLISPGYFELTKSIDVSFSGGTGERNTKIAGLEAAKAKLEEFLAESVGPTGRCEGLMLKSLYSLYSSNESREKSGGFGGWRKLKKDYVDSLADSIDVVPVGAWRGNGRKSKWFSPFLVAVFEPATGELQSLCRVMSGFSDEFYQEKFEFYSKKILDKRPDTVSTGESPPFWFEPSEVWEIRGADLTISPVHKAALGRFNSVEQELDLENDEGRGISLRFPRFIRVRDDKKVEEATSSSQILSLFNTQAQRQNN